MNRQKQTTQLTRRLVLGFLVAIFFLGCTKTSDEDCQYCVLGPGQLELTKFPGPLEAICDLVIECVCPLISNDPFSCAEFMEGLDPMQCVMYLEDFPHCYPEEFDPINPPPEGDWQDDDEYDDYGESSTSTEM